MKNIEKIQKLEKTLAMKIKGDKNYLRQVAITSLIRTEASKRLTSEEKEVEGYSLHPTDTLKKKCIFIFKEMESEGINMKGVRMPSL